MLARVIHHNRYIASPGALGGTADPQLAEKKTAVEAIHAKKHNSALDELQALVDRWNVEKKAFSEKAAK